MWLCCLNMCCVVLFHSVFVCKHVCAAIAKVPGGLCTFHFGVLAAF